MTKKVWIALLLCFIMAWPHTAMGQQTKVEVFQIDAGKVVRSENKTDLVQQEAEKSLASITGVFKKVNPLPNTGYLVKVPLDPAVQINHQTLSTLANEAVFVISTEQQPVIMLYDNENRVYFFEFNHDLSALRKELQL
ncbi:hypothetical protein FZC66_07110 [Priestia megaterium]|nr:hypothetical protein FZC66_07110 [Priestia megaterium]